MTGNNQTSLNSVHQASERVHVYVRVRPEFENEILEDQAQMQYHPNEYVPPEDENQIGCIKLEPNFPECITLDLQPQEMPRDFAFR